VCATFDDILDVLFVAETEANMIQERANNCDRFLESEAMFFFCMVSFAVLLHEMAMKE